MPAPKALAITNTAPFLAVTLSKPVDVHTASSKASEMLQSRRGAYWPISKVYIKCLDCCRPLNSRKCSKRMIALIDDPGFGGVARHEAELLSRHFLTTSPYQHRNSLEAVRIGAPDSLKFGRVRDT